MRIGTTALLVCMTIASLNLAASAQAKDFEVRYSKSELVTSLGAERVYNRILNTANDLCEYEFEQYTSSKTKLRYNRCLRRTIKEFVGQIDHFNIDQIYAGLPASQFKRQPSRTVELAENKGK